jgi:hypothetical protein
MDVAMAALDYEVPVILGTSHLVRSWKERGL